MNIKRPCWIQIAPVIAAVLILSHMPMLYARPDFHVTPFNLENRINGQWPARDTLYVSNLPGRGAADTLIWQLEIIPEDQEWLNVSRNEGVIPVDGVNRIAVAMHGPDLDEDHYFIDLHFTSNDPTREEYTVPVAGHRADYPRITTGWPRHWELGGLGGIDMNNFIDDIIYGEIYTFNLRIFNPGSAELVVEEIHSNSGYWEIVPWEFNVNPNQNQLVNVIFSAMEVGPNSTTITSISNAWDPRELEFRIVATVDPSFRLRANIPDMVIDEDAEEFVVVDLDTIFACSDPGCEFQFPRIPGLIPRIERNGEFLLQPRRNWHGISDVLITATVGDSVLADSFQVTVNPIPDPPAPFDLMTPSDGDTIRWDSEDSLFIWQSTTDPDGDIVTYSLTIHVTGNNEERTWSDLTDTTLTISILTEIMDVTEGGEFTWTVSASDGSLDRSALSAFTNYVVSTGVSGHDEPTLDDWRFAEVFPNPFNNNAIVKVHLEEACLLSIDVYDTHGRHLENIVNEVAPVGTYSFTWQPLKTESGLYLIRIKSAKSSQVYPVVLFR